MLGNKLQNESVILASKVNSPSAGWEKVRLEEIAFLGSGGTPSRKKTEYYRGSIPWIKTGELGTKYIKDTEEKITEEAIDKSSAKIFPKGSVAIAMYGATIGKTSILGIDASSNQACAVIQPVKWSSKNRYSISGKQARS